MDHVRGAAWCPGHATNSSSSRCRGGDTRRQAGPHPVGLSSTGYPMEVLLDADDDEVIDDEDFDEDEDAEDDDLDPDEEEDDDEETWQVCLP